MRRKRLALSTRHFEAGINVLCVRWYPRSALSFGQLEEIMAEQNFSVDHVAISRWSGGNAVGPELRNANRS
jgi:transposase-like protein